MILHLPPLKLPSPAALEGELQHRLSQYSTTRWLATTGSTNTDLVEQVKKSTSANFAPCLLGSHKQTQGKGRAGREWANQKGQSLMFSCGFATTLATNLLPGIAPYAGLTACLALRQQLPKELQSKLTLKWPNDLEWQGHKLAGILVEAGRMPPYHKAAQRFVIIGIGINLNGATNLATVLGRHITDWHSIERQISGSRQKPPRATVGDLVTSICQHWYHMMLEINRDGLTQLPIAYQQVDGLFNRQVNIMDNHEVLLSGTAKGLDATGALLVEDAQQNRQAIVVGEVSVRKSL